MDNLGRDVLSRTIHGSRVSLIAGVASIAFAVGVGVPLGTLAGYVGRWLDRVLVALMDTLMSFPALILALGLAAALGPGLPNIVIAIGVVYVPTFARLARGQTLAVRERDYVLAARTIGVPGLRIMFRHILPNIIDAIIVQATLSIAFAILWEAAISFLGVGVPPPTPTARVVTLIAQVYTKTVVLACDRPLAAADVRRGRQVLWQSTPATPFSQLEKEEVDGIQGLLHERPIVFDRDQPGGQDAHRVRRRRFRRADQAR